MALVKTNYGLIYNDDGSLCTTIRDDDIPFAGVKSFAVEEGTTNLATGDTASFQTGVGSWVNANFEAFSWQNVYNDFFKRNGVLYLKNTTDNGYIYWLYSNTTPQIYSASMYIKLISGNVNNIRCGGVFWYSDNTVTDYTWYDGGIAITRRIHLGNNIYRIETVNMMYDQSKLDAGKTIKHFEPRISVNSTTQTTEFYVLAYQLEARPFATSFVDGTRPAGILKIPGVRDFTSKVVTAWFKINYVRNYPRIFDMSDGSTDVAKGWAFYYDHVAGGFCFGVGSTVTKLTYSNPTNKWFYVVLIFNNGTYAVKLFDDSGLIWDYSFTATMPDLTNNIFKIGNVDSSGGYARPLNGPIAAPHIAEYKPSIWTAEYIQELYNMRRPFSAPPRMPII